MDLEPAQQKGSLAAKNFFLYFLTFALLYTVAINFGGILFDFINKFFPLATEYGRSGFQQGAIRFHLASLIIATPVYLWLSAKIYKEAAKSELVRYSGIRRWLTYITLILAALIVIGDLISLVYNLLGGETTIRFVLKSLVVLGIATAIFYYYLAELKNFKSGSDEQPTENKLPKLYFSSTTILVIASVVGGFFLIESPLMQRMRNQDSARLNALQEIESTLYQHASVNGKLPKSLSEIELREGVSLDPVTSKAYEYRVTGDAAFELCAMFETSNKEAAAENYFGVGWLHEKGPACFKRTVPDYDGYYGKENPPLRPIPVD